MEMAMSSRLPTKPLRPTHGYAAGAPAIGVLQCLGGVSYILFLVKIVLF